MWLKKFCNFFVLFNVLAYWIFFFSDFLLDDAEVSPAKKTKSFQHQHRPYPETGNELMIDMCFCPHSLRRNSVKNIYLCRGTFARNFY